MDAFYRGFEKQANQYDMAVQHHVDSFNRSALLNRSKVKARRERKGDGDYITLETPGRRGFLGIGKKEGTSESKRIIDNTKGQVNKSQTSPAIYFGKSQIQILGAIMDAFYRGFEKRAEEMEVQSEEMEKKAFPRFG